MQVRRTGIRATAAVATRRVFLGDTKATATRSRIDSPPVQRKGFGGAGVLEIVEDEAGDTYHAVYTVKFKEGVFVLHRFQKKSTRGISTPKQDLDVIRARLKIAEAIAWEQRHGEAHQ